jgi:hypothetical protein
MRARRLSVIKFTRLVSKSLPRPYRRHSTAASGGRCRNPDGLGQGCWYERRGDQPVFRRIGVLGCTQLQPNTWRLPAEGLDRVIITPPRNFVGAVDFTLELRLADSTVADRIEQELADRDCLCQSGPNRDSVMRGLVDASFVRSNAQK